MVLNVRLVIICEMSIGIGIDAQGAIFVMFSIGATGGVKQITEPQRRNVDLDAVINAPTVQ